MTTTSDFETFFHNYAEASMSADPQRIAAFYAPTFIVGGPKGSAAYANDAGFIEWLKSVADFNQQAGMESMGVASVHAHELNALQAVATATYSARFKKTGDQPIEFKITYLLEGTGADRKILSYISHTDQEEEMKRFNLLP